VVCHSQRGLLYPLTIGDEVNFRLTYDGPLKAASQSDPRRKPKHEMRRVFSRQLHELHSVKDDFLDQETDPLEEAIVRRGDFLFLALVRKSLDLVCDLDILFLRRENPGELIHSGGDLDNRIKVLFDALRIPQNEDEVRDFQPEPPKKKELILCLTEDDKQITGFRVTTDRLLKPALSEAEQHHVQLIINVEIKATRLTDRNLRYFSHF